MDRKRIITILAVAALIAIVVKVVAAQKRRDGGESPTDGDLQVINT